MCMTKERPFPWQFGLARGLSRDKGPWHFQLGMLPFFPARHLSGSEARVLCVPGSSLPPSTGLTQTMLWFKTSFCKRGLGGSQGPAIVISLCFGSTASHEGFFLSISYHVLGPWRLPGEGSYYHRPSCQEWHTSPYLKLLPQMTSSTFTSTEEEERGTWSWGWQWFFHSVASCRIITRRTAHSLKCLQPKDDLFFQIWLHFPWKWEFSRRILFASASSSSYRHL